MTGMPPKNRFAVAVRDGTVLFLWLWIKRAPAADIYVMLPTGRSDPYWKNWNPHASYHASGQFHHKSFDGRLLVKHLQKPDENFVGVHNLLQRGIAAHEPRAFGVICNLADFHQIAEFSVALLDPHSFKTYTNVDIAGPADSPTVPG